MRRLVFRGQVEIVPTRRIAGGDAGIFQTLGHMRRLANAGVRDPLTLDLVGAIVEGSAGHRPTQVAAIRSYLESAVEFLSDPVDVELLRSVPEMLATIERRGIVSLDCDDVAILGAALGKAAGLRARFTVLGFHPSRPYSHVFTELYDGRRWIDLDITRYDQPAARIYRKATYHV